MDFFESTNTEFKETYVTDIKKEVIAFANTNGGNIYIGVLDNGEIIGIESPDVVLLQTVNGIRDSIKPDITMFIDCTVQLMKGKHIVQISVQRGVDRPYYLSDKGLKPTGVYVRQGSASVPASYDAIRQMIKETDGDSYEKLRSLKQDLTFDTTTAEVKKHNLDFGIPQGKTLGIIGEDDLYTNLGLLLSDQCQHSIKVAYFEGTKKRIFKDRREFQGSLLHQLTESYQYIDLYNKTHASFVDLERIDNRDYPPDAIREALLNAIIHREYSFSGSTLINIYEDRIEFITLGGLVSGLSLDAIMLGVSQSRNEKLANFFYRLRMIEAYETGIAKIFSNYIDHHIEPTINAVSGAFQVVLPNRNFRTNSDNQVNERISYGRKEPKKQYNVILKLIEINGFVTRKEVQTHLDVGQTRALALLKEMVNQNYITPVGNSKKTRYVKNSN